MLPLSPSLDIVGILAGEVSVLSVALTALAVHRDTLRTWPGQREKCGADVGERLRMAEATAAVPPYGRRDRLRDAYLAAMAGLDVLVCPVAACDLSLMGSPDLVVEIPPRELVLPFMTQVLRWACSSSVRREARRRALPAVATLLSGQNLATAELGDAG